MDRIIINKCPASDMCDCCASVPPEACQLKKAIKYCKDETEKRPHSIARSQLQMGKIILAEEIFEILDVNISSN